MMGGGGGQMGAGGGSCGNIIILGPGQKAPVMAKPHFCNICLITWKCHLTKDSCKQARILTCNECHRTLKNTIYRGMII